MADNKTEAHSSSSSSSLSETLSSPPSLIDVHAHLYYPEFENDLDDVISSAKARGVQKIFVVSHDVPTAIQIRDMSERYPGFIIPFAAAHPVQKFGGCVTRYEVEEALKYIHQNHSDLAGIGECGLDFSPFVFSQHDKEASNAMKDTQRWALEEFGKLSREYDLPLNVHSRSAGRPTIKLLQDCNVTKVNMHAFDGSYKVAKLAIQSGYYFSVPPSIARGEGIQKLIRDLPLSNLLLESDAPALAPVKMTRNEPANIHVSCSEIARVKGLTFEEVAAQTTANAKHLFPKAFAMDHAG